MHPNQDIAPNTKLLALTLAASIALIGGASATVTLQFSVAGQGFADGFLGSNGETSGLTWGIVVDTGNNGFLGTDPGAGSVYWDSFVISNGSCLTAGPGGWLTDDMLWPIFNSFEDRVIENQRVAMAQQCCGTTFR